VPPLPSLPCGSTKSCIGVRTSRPLHVVALQKFRIQSKPIYFRNLSWIRDCNHRQSPYVCEYSEVLSFVAPKSLHQSHYIRIFMTLRSAMSASSSTLVQERNPRVQSTRVCPQNLDHYSITNR
jgi:hypothetical protein